MTMKLASENTLETRLANERRQYVEVSGKSKNLLLVSSNSKKFGRIKNSSVSV
jgi:hypothetical protein